MHSRALSSLEVALRVGRVDHPQFGAVTLLTADQRVKAVRQWHTLVTALPSDARRADTLAWGRSGQVRSGQVRSPITGHTGKADTPKIPLL